MVSLDTHTNWKSRDHVWYIFELAYCRVVHQVAHTTHTKETTKGIRPRSMPHHAIWDFGHLFGGTTRAYTLTQTHTYTLTRFGHTGRDVRKERESLHKMSVNECARVRFVCTSCFRGVVFRVVDICCVCVSVFCDRK